jgi:hypothetical protein
MRRNGTGGGERPSASGCRSPDDAGGQPERDVRVRAWWEAAPTMAGPVGIVRRPEPTRTVPAGDDLFNLVVSPAFLVIAWAQVGCNRGARTAGVDGVTAHYIEDVCGVEPFLTDLRAVGPDTRVACASVVRW